MQTDTDCIREKLDTMGGVHHDFSYIIPKQNLCKNNWLPGLCWNSNFLLCKRQ